jgi:apolipoprotein D and lipocalin family protein
MRLLIAAALALASAGCLPPVNRVSMIPLAVTAIEPARYGGLWYEIARLPNAFESDCEGVTAAYFVQPDAAFSVVNTCRIGAPDGKVRVAKGRARIVDPVTHAKLKVSFFGPFEGDYWVLDRAPDYSWSLVGEPRGRYLWMLARTARISPTLKKDLLRRLRQRGYRLEALHWTRQAPG